LEWQKKYRWRRTWGNETGLNGLPHEDYVGFDGDVQIGRIYLDRQTLKAGKWRWAIQYPKGGKAYQPNTGWETTAAEAAKVVEDLWDVQKARL
jgi:hypothetical protein